MPTYLELRGEAAWREQIIPPNLSKLRREIAHAFNLSELSVQIFGDSKHLKGYHRSRRWILGSRYCTDREYSTTETPGNRSGGNDNWICGMDIVCSEQLATSIHTRLHRAMDRGKAPAVRQSILERDPWHVHISFDRGRANDDHSELLKIITGTTPQRGEFVNIEMKLPVLRMGDQGLDVATAQGVLNARGYDVKIDGDFGPITEKCTRLMQRAYGAEHVDGIWGPETWTIGLTRKDTR